MRVYHGFLLASGIVSVLAGATMSPAAERRYSITDFDEVRIVGNHLVDIQVGRGTTVSGSGDTAALDGISIETQGRILVIQTLQQSASTWKPATAGAARISITVPQLKTIRVEGSGSATVAELRGPQTTISLTGSGLITVSRLISDRAYLRLAGSGRVTLTGDVKNLDINAKGPGDIAAEQLSVNDLKILSASSGRVFAKALRSADVKQNGSGQVIVTGKPACTVENLGSGTVSCGEQAP